MIGFIEKLSVIFPRDALMRIYKSFIRPQMDYRDIIYDKLNSESFKKKNLKIFNIKIALQ